MKHTNSSKWSMIVMLALALAGCKGCGESDADNGVREIVEGESDLMPEEGAIEFTEEMRVVLEEHLDDYLGSFAEGRHKDAIDLSHPHMFGSDAEKVLSLEEMKAFWDRGVRTHYNSHKLTYISPMFDIDSMYVGLIKWDIDSELRFLDHFDGTQSNYQTQLRSMYAFATVTHDSANNRYTMVGEQHAFIFMPKDSIDFLFTSTAYVQNARIHKMIDFDTLTQLREYE